MHKLVHCACALFVGAICGMGTATAQYNVFVDFDDIHVGNQYNILGLHAFDGDTMYAIVRGIESDITPEWESQITKIVDIEGTPTPSVLVTNAEWKAYTGGEPADTILPGNRMHLVGDQLQFLDYNTDGIYRVDTLTGDLTTVFDPNDANNLTGAGYGNLIDAVAISPWNEMAFYDQTSNNVFLVDPNGTVSTFIDQSEFVAAYASLPVNYVAGGMTFDHRGVLYWTLTQTGSTGAAGGHIYKRDCDGTISIVLYESNIQDHTFAFQNVGYNDLYYAPDGNLYFYDRASDSIIYVNPADPRLPIGDFAALPPDLIYTYLSESELTSGPAGNDFVGSFDSYGDDLAWNHSLSKDSPDVYNLMLAGPPISPADYDRDTFVDILDYDNYAADLTGPETAYDPMASATEADCRGYLPADADKDGDIDLADLPLLQIEFSGS